MSYKQESAKVSKFSRCFSILHQIAVISFFITNNIFCYFCRKFIQGMFFGLFSTHLPFVIVGLVYLASFGVVSVQRLVNSVSEEDDAVEFSFHNRTFSENNGHILVYRLPDDQHQYSVAFIQQHFSDHPIPEVLIKLFTALEPPLCSFHSGEFFTRPPPATAV